MSLKKPLQMVSWNLEKKPELIRWVLNKYRPHVALFQEVRGDVQVEDYESIMAVSFRDHRVPIGAASFFEGPKGLTDSWPVLSKNGDYRLKFWLGKIYKAALMAYSHEHQLWIGNIHAFNGWPQKDISKLVAHVRALLQVIDDEGPGVIAGDFNTWTDEHLASVIQVMAQFGFSYGFGVKYDSRKTMDHVFSRGVQIRKLEEFKNDSDHPGFLFEVR